MIITISRQYGAGGSEVAQRVADRSAGGWWTTSWSSGSRRQAGLPPRTWPTGRSGSRASSSGWPGRCGASTPEAGPVPASGTGDRTGGAGPGADHRSGWWPRVAAKGRAVLVGRAAPAVLAREREALHVSSSRPGPAGSGPPPSAWLDREDAAGSWMRPTAPGLGTTSSTTGAMGGPGELPHGAEHGDARAGRGREGDCGRGGASGGG